MTPTIQHRDRIRAFASVHAVLVRQRAFNIREPVCGTDCYSCASEVARALTGSTPHADSASALLRVGLSGRQ